MRYLKAIAAVVAAALAFIASVNSDGMSGQDWVNVAIAVVTAVGVYLVPEVPSQPWAKTAVATLGAGLVVLASAITDGHVTSTEWINIILAGLGAVGVHVVSNIPSDTTPATVETAPGYVDGTTDV